MLVDLLFEAVPRRGFVLARSLARRCAYDVYARLKQYVSVHRPFTVTAACNNLPPTRFSVFVRIKSKLQRTASADDSWPPMHAADRRKGLHHDARFSGQQSRGVDRTVPRKSRATTPPVSDLPATPKRRAAVPGPAHPDTADGTDIKANGQPQDFRAFGRRGVDIRNWAGGCPTWTGTDGARVFGRSGRARLW